MRQSQRGFTIVELLIVIVVIGILAAITVTAYNGAQGKANDAAILSDLKNLRTKVLLFNVDHDYYPYAADLTLLEYKATKSAYQLDPSNGSLHYCYSYTGGNLQFGVAAISKSGRNFYTSMDAQPQQYSGPLSFTTNVCDSLSQITGLTLTRDFVGYNPTDTVTGPWRAWAGGN